MRIFKNILLAALLTVFAMPEIQAQKLVILSTNDTHSQIEPTAKGMGGILRRRAAFDRVRAENKNVIVVDAGDVVQGTVFFSLYRGEVEYACMDSLGYDINILGNHEFDNGLDELAAHYRNLKSTKLSANYDFSGTPLQDLFEPYTIRDIEGKKVAFIGINVEPAGLISEKNYKGMRYIPCDKVADALAHYLKTVIGVDYVVMISHIGYDSIDAGAPVDPTIVAASRDIDLLIGGHSHTLIKPDMAESHVTNANGKPIVIGQNGKTGEYIGRYDIDLATGKVEYSQIAIDKTLDADAARYTAMNRWLNRYRNGVDSLMNSVIGKSNRTFVNREIAAQNWLCDAVLDILPGVSGVKKVDVVIMNKGGIRNDMPKGNVTEGLMMSMFPFDNRFVVMEISGKDLLDALNVMASRGGDAISRGMKVEFNKAGKVTKATLNGKKIDPKKTYVLGTIDYLANGGDYMTPLLKGNRLFVDDVKYGDHIINYIKNDLTAKGKAIDAGDQPRMYEK